jgi:hypothetical protein
VHKLHSLRLRGPICWDSSKRFVVLLTTITRTVILQPEMKVHNRGRSAKVSLPVNFLPATNNNNRLSGVARVHGKLKASSEHWEIGHLLRITAAKE